MSNQQELDPSSETAKQVATQIAETTKVVATQAVEAAKVVTQINKRTDERTASLIVSGIREFFDQADKEKRFIDTQRIPFICDDIKGIHKELKDIARLVYIGIGIISAVSILVNFILK